MIRTTTTTALCALLLTTLAGCNSDSDDAGTKPSTTPAASRPAPRPSVDCSDTSLSQAEWMEHCSDKADGKSAGLHFGQSFTWDDGVTVTVTEARVFTDYDPELGEKAEAGQTDFRVKLKVANKSKTPFDLGTLSTIVEGATNGGEASSSEFSRGSEPLSGRLGAGVSVVKTDDNVLEDKYGRKVVVTVQRAGEGQETFDFPEFTGTIAG